MSDIKAKIIDATLCSPLFMKYYSNSSAEELLQLKDRVLLSVFKAVISNMGAHNRKIDNYLTLVKEFEAEIAIEEMLGHEQR